jgi:DNA repair photolyase
VKINSRAFVSFDEYCPFDCKHCYTYDIERTSYRSMDEIVNSISKQQFDVVYVSQKNDNFAVPERGIQLCQNLFDKYRCNIFAITRNTLSDRDIHKIQDLSIRMRESNKLFVFAVSISAIESASKTENADRVPSPLSRIAFIKQLSDSGIPVIAMIRPVYPDKIIPITELAKIIDLCRGHVSCVVSGGLGVNDNILARLDMTRDAFTYYENYEYLQGAIDCEINFVNVADELNLLRAKCAGVSLPFFEHSMPALNFLYNQAMKIA